MFVATSEPRRPDRPGSNVASSEISRLIASRAADGAEANAPNGNFMEQLARVKAALLTSALRGLDPHQSLHNCEHLSERRTGRCGVACHNRVTLSERTLLVLNAAWLPRYVRNEPHP